MIRKILFLIESVTQKKIF